MLGVSVFTTTQAARLLSVSPRLLTKWIDRGMLAGYRVPGTAHRRVTREALVAFCDEHGIPLPAALKEPKPC